MEAMESYRTVRQVSWSLEGAAGRLGTVLVLESCLGVRSLLLFRKLL
jgi:hypothetical protein